MRDKDKTTWVGWQGVVAEVPSDWSLVAVSGEEKTGYFRAQSTEKMALEVRWSKLGKADVDLYAKLNAYLNDLRRKARKKKLDLEHKIKTKEADILTFSWKADRRAQGRLWKCDQCRRVIIAQISGELTDEVGDPASWILPSIEDHSEDGWRTWAMYDLIAETPPGYRYEKHRLMSGYIQLIFRKGNNRLTIERWGLANVALKKCTLRDWFSARAMSELKNHKYSIEDMEFEDERGIEVRGRRKGFNWLWRSFWALTGFRRPALHLSAYAWVCEEANKIYSIQLVHTRREKVIDEVLEKVECH